MRKLLTIASMLLFLTLMPVQMANAASLDDPQAGTSMTNTESEKTGGISTFSLSRSRKDPYTGEVYTHSDKNSGKSIVYGIDVSSHNGSINWKDVKDDGIEYVIVRAGYRGYSGEGKLNKDDNFKENITGATKAGLKVGVYFFSQAITRQEAIDEANYVVKLIKDYNITLPVVMDYEYASVSGGTGGRLHDAGLSVNKATDICRAFASTVRDSGYTSMVYANKAMLENHLDVDSISKKSLIWLANYTTKSSYAGTYDAWQYTSKGSVDGISGNVDCSFWYTEANTVYQRTDYSAVYDYDYYVEHNPDIKKAVGTDKRAAIEHFVNYGMAEGRRGNEEFDVTTYKNRYADLRNAYGNDLKQYYLHYMNMGKQEGRSGRPVGEATIYDGIDYSEVYNYVYYTTKYPDIKMAFGGDENQALAHFVNCGMSEGRQGSDTFNVQTYKNRYVDLRNAFGNDLKSYYMHYINSGRREGRSATGTSDLIGGVSVYRGVDYSAVYDYKYYITNNSDVKSACKDDFAALEHFVNYGMAEGRQACAEFNVRTYRNRYKDLKAAFGNDLRQYYIHYMNCGKQEGRKGDGTVDIGVTVYNGVDYSAVYNFKYYIATYADIKNAFGDDGEAALQHFVNYGMAEGRQGCSDFSVNTYMRRYKDLRTAYGNDLRQYYLHYMFCGKQEGRSGAGTVEISDTVYNDVDYSAVYNYTYYISHNPDLKRAFGDDKEAAIEHFVYCGMSEGRRASEEFDVNYYQKSNADLRSAFGSDLKEYYLHYMYCGKDEGRKGVEPEKAVVLQQTEPVIPVVEVPVEDSVTEDEQKSVVLQPEETVPEEEVQPEETVEEVQPETENKSEDADLEEPTQSEENSADEEATGIDSEEETVVEEDLQEEQLTEETEVETQEVQE